MEANILRILIILVGAALVGVIFLQQPKQGGIGGSFGGGSGASGSVFGARGATSFFFKLTGGLAVLFVVLILAMVKFTAVSANKDSIVIGGNQKTIIEESDKPVSPENTPQVDKDKASEQVPE